ncbi:ABC transporter substrate-binding protein [Haloarchaeobius sp. HME9146]|uniref:ABC transporter substrate-binding protein n=1 Tax=Haloarchaeobius sp. HME9146 TaxID=2978732 RepID=UPI0021BE0B0D|nr:extracellular solute-binding protein [Haloarchaeobius sp. HME9146]MCT9095602.1 extracellular solute-binding protein [Haloarchaeobius sp. HME9146]
MSGQERTIDRRTVLKGTGAASLFALAGCVSTGGGGGDTTNGGGGGGGGGGDTTNGGGGGGETAMADSIEAWGWDVAAKSLDLTDEPYEEANGGDVSITQIGRSDMKDKFKSKLLAGSGAPAAAMMESVDAAAWIDTGGLRDVSGWLDDDVKSKFVSGKWGPLTKDGGVYAMPWDIGPVGTFYREDVLAEHDVDLSTVETWDQFIEEGKKLPDGQYMINLPSNDYDGLWRMQYRQLGGQPFTKDGKVAFNNDTSVRVAQNLKAIKDAGIADSKASWSSAWFSAFGDGTIASLNGGAWMEGTLKAELPSTSGNWRVMKPPAYESGGGRATNWGGSNLVIADQVSDAKARRAWDYMQYTLASKEMQIKMYKNFGIFPAYKPAYESDEFDTKNEFLGGQRAGRMFAEVAPNIPSYRYTVDTPEVTKAINTHFSDMMDGKVSPTKAVEKAAQQVADRTGRDLA